DYIERPFHNLPLYALGMALFVCVLIEVMIFVHNRFAKPEWRQVSRWSIRQRIEENQRMEQVFCPSRVIPRTDKVIEKVVERHGIQNISWLTNTAPDNHLKTFESAAITWAKESQKEWNSAERLLRANVRIIVASDEAKEKIIKRHPWAQRFRVAGSFPFRLMILNEQKAIIHIPLPHRGGLYEESNFAAITEDMTVVAELQQLFDSLFESPYRMYAGGAIAQELQNPLACPILQVVAESYGGLTFMEIDAALTSNAIIFRQNELRNVLDELLEQSKLIRLDDRGKYHLTRRSQSCILRDTIARAFDEDYISESPWEKCIQTN
ncbi:MAG: hypothetical protein ACYTF1_24810, partial [Planctomycetota bacterium]